MVSLSMHVRVCVHLHTQYINENHLHLSYKKVSACVLVFVHALVFPPLSGDQGCCIQGTIWAQVTGVQRLFYSLSDRRSYERFEGARKTVVSWACELLYSQSWCFGILAVQSCRKYKNRLFWPL